MREEYARMKAQEIAAKENEIKSGIEKLKKLGLTDDGMRDLMSTIDRITNYPKLPVIVGMM